MGYIKVDSHWIRNGEEREEAKGDRDRERSEPEEQVPYTSMVQLAQLEDPTQIFWLSKD